MTETASPSKNICTEWPASESASPCRNGNAAFVGSSDPQALFIMILSGLCVACSLQAVMPRNGKAITCDRNDRRAMETSWFSRTTAHTNPDRLGDSIHRAAVLTETAPVGRVVKPPNDTNQAVVEPGSSGAISDIHRPISARLGATL